MYSSKFQLGDIVQHVREANALYEITETKPNEYKVKDLNGVVWNVGEEVWVLANIVDGDLRLSSKLSKVLV